MLTSKVTQGQSASPTRQCLPPDPLAAVPPERRRGRSRPARVGRSPAAGVFAAAAIRVQNPCLPSCAPSAAASRQEADADHRQPLRDDGLGSAQEPGGLRAAGALRGRNGLDRGAEPRDRDRARGARPRLRRGRRLRRRRDAERGGQRAGRDRRAGLGAAGGLDQRRLPHARAFPTTSSTPPSTCWRWSTTGSRGKIDLGKVDDRHFVFSCGAGIDATVVKRVDAHPRLKSAAGPYYFSWAAISAFYRSYLLNPVRLRAEIGGGESARASPRSPRTPTPSPTSPAARCGSARGSRSTTARSALGVLKRATQRDMPTLIVAPLQRRASPPPATARSSTSTTSPRRPSASVSETKDGILRPFPVQVDGDYIGEKTRLELRAEPGALTVIA